MGEESDVSVLEAPELTPRQRQQELHLVNECKDLADYFH